MGIDHVSLKADEVVAEAAREECLASLAADLAVARVVMTSPRLLIPADLVSLK